MADSDSIDTHQQQLDELADALRPGYEGEPVRPDPPFSDEDPFAHAAMSEARERARRENPKLPDDEYQVAFTRWRDDTPVTPGRAAQTPEPPFFRVAGQRAPTGTVMNCDRCPVCDAPADAMPGCYVPYQGRRWDCAELWGRNLTGPERAALVEHHAAEPQHVDITVRLPD